MRNACMEKYCKNLPRNKNHWCTVSQYCPGYWRSRGTFPSAGQAVEPPLYGMYHS